MAKKDSTTIALRSNLYYPFRVVDLLAHHHYFMIISSYSLGLLSVLIDIAHSEDPPCPS
ncbi:MAG: hypothetical protein WAL93_15750 [Desulfobacterales bacterium]